VDSIVDDVETQLRQEAEVCVIRHRGLLPGCRRVDQTNMKHNVEFKNFEPEEKIRKLIAQLINKLQKRAKRFPPDEVFLRLMIEENSVRKLYHVSLVLEIPGKSPASKKTLATKEERHDLNETIRDAFDEIERQLEAYKSTLIGEHLWKQRTRRDKLRQMKAVVVPDEQSYRELFFSLASRQLKGLYEFARHELAYSESVGDLIPGELTPEEVVDGVLLRAYREFVKNPAGREMKNWLVELAREQLEAEVKRLKSQREHTVHIEEDIPESPPTEAVSTLGEEILDFHQPDEDLKLEDVIPDLKIPLPEQIAETKELRRCVNTALAGLPEEWRQALWLRHGEGLTGAKLAKAIGKSEPEIERTLEYTLQYVRQRLVELGCQFKENDNRTSAPAESEQVAKNSATS
jgi:RNA polymerase sigma factor (sigma-70 family)